MLSMMAFATNETGRYAFREYMLSMGPGGMAVLGILGLIWLIAVLYVIYDVMAHKREMHPVDKLIWIIIALIFNVIGAILYYIVEKRKK